MARLDPTMPYDVAYGLQGVSLLQGGKAFKLNGREIGAPDDGLPDSPNVDPMAGFVAETAHRPSNFNEMHWLELRALVEAYGGNWTDKDTAIQFLQSR